MFRNKAGEEITMEEAERMMRQDRIEVGYDEMAWNGGKLLVHTRLQPVWLHRGEPLFKTLVMGDSSLGTMDYATNSEDEAVHLHRALVNRYRAIEEQRQRGVHESLLDGAL